MFLVEEYRQESGADMVLGNYKMDDGTFALIVLDAQGYFAQQISFKRDYPLKAQQSLIATIGLDMLRRYVQKKTVYRRLVTLSVSLILRLNG